MSKPVWAEVADSLPTLEQLDHAIALLRKQLRTLTRLRRAIAADATNGASEDETE